MKARSILLVMGAALGLAGAILHALGFLEAGPSIGESSLSPFLKEAFASLWFADSLTTAIVASIALVATVRPNLVSATVLRLIAAIPIGTGLMILGFIGPFYAAFLLILIGGLLLAGSATGSDREAAQQ